MAAATDCKGCIRNVFPSASLCNTPALLAFVGRQELLVQQDGDTLLFLGLQAISILAGTAHHLAFLALEEKPAALDLCLA